MEITKKELPGKKIRILFATNKKELDLLYGICKKALVLFPDVTETAISHNRLQKIVQDFYKALNNWDDIPIENEKPEINQAL